MARVLIRRGPVVARSRPGQVGKVCPVVSVRYDRQVTVVLVVAVGVGWKVHIARMRHRSVHLGMRGVGLRRAGEVLAVTSALPVETIPDPKANAGLYQPFGAVAQVVQHLRLAPLVAETHHDKGVANGRAQGLRGHQLPFAIAKPGSSPKPDLIDATLPEGIACTP